MPIQVKTTRSDYVAKSDDAIINDVCKNHNVSSTNNMPKKCCHAQLDKILMHAIKHTTCQTFLSN